MDLNLRDKVVLVTGGAKGIGAAIIRVCAQEHATAVAVDRDQAAGEQLRSELKNQGLATSLLSTSRHQKIVATLSNKP